MNSIQLSFFIAILIESLICGHKKHHKTKSRSYPSNGCGSNDEYIVPMDYFEESLIHDNIERTYLTHLPSNYDHSSITGYPLVLNLHGASMNSYEAMISSYMNNHSDEHNYIAVYPDSTSYGSMEWNGNIIDFKTWNNLGCSVSPTADGPTCNQFSKPDTSNIDGIPQIPENCRDTFGCNHCNCNIDDVGFIDILLDELEEKYCIDRSRIYVTGLSNGAEMTQTLGCELNHRLAAIAPMHGQNVLGYNCSPKYKRKMPILNIWGTQDQVQPGDTIQALSLELYGQYRLSVYQVQYKYGQHNKCNPDSNKYVTIPSVSDGINEWQCVGYDECDFDQDGNYETDGMSCSWNGGHWYPVNYGEEDSEERDFGLNVIWNFFKDKTKIPPGY